MTDQPSDRERALEWADRMERGGWRYPAEPGVLAREVRRLLEFEKNIRAALENGRCDWDEVETMIVALDEERERLGWKPE